MARRTTRPPPEPPGLPALTVARAEADAKILDRIQKAVAIREGLGRGDAQAEADNDRWHAYNAQLLESLFSNASEAENYQHTGTVAVILSRGEGPRERGARLTKRLGERVNDLQSLRERLELFAEPAAADRGPESSVLGERPRAAFIVHGHDDGAREATARVLQQLGVEPIILHEQPNQGRTILEKIEAHAGVPFAVVLLTPDDVGGTSADNLKPRARQNVVLELGYFWGKLSSSHVCVLYKEGVELPSDLGGLVYVKMDDGRGWRFKLAEELDAAGIQVDFNRLRGS